MFAMLSHTSVMVADTIMVGSLGKEAIAAAGIGGLAFWLIISFLMGLSVGIQIIVSRRFGEKNFNIIGEAVKTSLGFAFIIGLLLTVFGILTSEYLMKFITSDKKVYTLASEYINYRFMGLSFLFLIFVFNGLYNGISRTFVTMITAFTASITNILFNYILIFGEFGFKAYGVAGAGMASGLSAMVAFLVPVGFLFDKKIKSLFHFNQVKINLKLLKEILVMSLPPGAEGFLTHLAFVFFYKIAGLISVTAIASTNIVFSIMTISFMPGFSFGIAATSLVGQAMGAKKKQLAYHAGFRSAFFSALIMGFIGLMFFIFAKEILHLFTSDVVIIKEAYPALILMAFIQIGDAYHMVIGSALKGAGLVNWVMIVYAIVSFFIMLPIAYLLGITFNLGTLGIWLSVFVWLFILAITFIFKFKNKSWMARTF